MATTNFQFSFETLKQPNEIFLHLIDPKNWWVGLYGEEIEGQSKNTGDEFTFKAGHGIHYSKQKLIELIPNQKIVWSVSESVLSFLKNKNEWAGTKICFDIKQENGKTKITFSHNGLTPEIECYDQCSSAWTQYLQNLKQKLS